MSRPGKGSPAVCGLRESNVVAACLQYLLARRLFVWRNNSGAMPVQNATGARRFVRFGAVGSPDIIGILPGGRFLGVECKGPSGKQSPAQAAFEARVIASGGVYILARSVDDLKEAGL